MTDTLKALYLEAASRDDISGAEIMFNARPEQLSGLIELKKYRALMQTHVAKPTRRRPHRAVDIRPGTIELDPVLNAERN